MATATSSITVSDIKQAYEQGARSSIRACELAARWIAEGGEGKDHPAAYLAAALGVTKGRVRQLVGAGKCYARSAALAKVRGLTEMHFRPILSLDEMDQDAVLAEAVKHVVDGRLDASKVRELADPYRQQKTERSAAEGVTRSRIVRAVEKLIDQARGIGDNKLAARLKEAINGAD